MMNKKKKISSANNIWDIEKFKNYRGEGRNIVIEKIKYIGICIRSSWQRIVRGYSDYDKHCMHDFLQRLIPEMLQDLKSPRNKEWNETLDRMIFLWKESHEDTCSWINPYEEEFEKAEAEFEKKYGPLGEALMTEEDLERYRLTGEKKIYCMENLKENEELAEKYYEQLWEIGDYRIKCKDEAMDLLKEYFFDLSD